MERSQQGNHDETWEKFIDENLKKRLAARPIHRRRDDGPAREQFRSWTVPDPKDTGVAPGKTCDLENELSEGDFATQEERRRTKTKLVFLKDTPTVEDEMNKSGTWHRHHQVKQNSVSEYLNRGPAATAKRSTKPRPLGVTRSSGQSTSASRYSAVDFDEDDDDWYERFQVTPTPLRLPRQPVRNTAEYDSLLDNLTSFIIQDQDLSQRWKSTSPCALEMDTPVSAPVSTIMLSTHSDWDQSKSVVTPTNKTAESENDGDTSWQHEADGQESQLLQNPSFRAQIVSDDTGHNELSASEQVSGDQEQTVSGEDAGADSDAELWNGDVSVAELLVTPFRSDAHRRKRRKERT